MRFASQATNTPGCASARATCTVPGPSRTAGPPDPRCIRARRQAQAGPAGRRRAGRPRGARPRRARRRSRARRAAKGGDRARRASERRCRARCARPREGCPCPPPSQCRYHGPPMRGTPRGRIVHRAHRALGRVRRGVRGRRRRKRLAPAVACPRPASARPRHLRAAPAEPGFTAVPASRGKNPEEELEIAVRFDASARAPGAPDATETD